MIKYSLATETWTQEEKEAAKSVIDSGMCTMGTITKQFEEEFAKKVGSKFAVFVNSGSSANLVGVASLMYHSKGLKKGDEVIVPMVSWPTTYYPLEQMGLKLKFVDVNLHDFNISVEEIKKEITSETKAIFAVNLLGNPCDYNELRQIRDDHNLILMEDNCESLGAEYQGKQCGTFGIFGTYSTFFSHHICTVEGGLVVTDDEELYHIMLSVRSHGWIRHLPKENCVYNKSGNNFEDSFKFVLPGYNVRGNDIFAAIGLKQLDKLDNIIHQRRLNAKYLIENLNSDHVTLQDSKEGSSWFGFGFIVEDRDSVVKNLVDNGIEVRPIVAGNFCKNPVMKYFDNYTTGSDKNANILDNNGFFIGNNGEELNDQIDHFLTVIG